MLVVKYRKRDSKDPQRPSPDQLVHLFAKVGMDCPGRGFEAGQFALPGHIRAGAFVTLLRVEEVRGLSGQEMVAAVMGRRDRIPPRGTFLSFMGLCKKVERKSPKVGGRVGKHPRLRGGRHFGHRVRSALLLSILW